MGDNTNYRIPNDWLEIDQSELKKLSRTEISERYQALVSSLNDLKLKFKKQEASYKRLEGLMDHVVDNNYELMVRLNDEMSKVHALSKEKYELLEDLQKTQKNSFDTPKNGKNDRVTVETEKRLDVTKIPERLLREELKRSTNETTWLRNKKTVLEGAVKAAKSEHCSTLSKVKTAFDIICGKNNSEITLVKGISNEDICLYEYSPTPEVEIKPAMKSESETTLTGSPAKKRCEESLESLTELTRNTELFNQLKGVMAEFEPKRFDVLRAIFYLWNENILNLKDFKDIFSEFGSMEYLNLGEEQQLMLMKESTSATGSLSDFSDPISGLKNELRIEYNEIVDGSSESSTWESKSYLDQLSRDNFDDTTKKTVSDPLLKPNIGLDNAIQNNFSVPERLKPYYRFTESRIRIKNSLNDQVGSVSNIRYVGEHKLESVDISAKNLEHENVAEGETHYPVACDDLSGEDNSLSESEVGEEKKTGVGKVEVIIENSENDKYAINLNNPPPIKPRCGRIKKCLDSISPRKIESQSYLSPRDRKNHLNFIELSKNLSQNPIKTLEFPKYEILPDLSPRQKTESPRPLSNKSDEPDLFSTLLTSPIIARRNKFKSPSKLPPLEKDAVKFGIAPERDGEPPVTKPFLASPKYEGKISPHGTLGLREVFHEPLSIMGVTHRSTNYTKPKSYHSSCQRQTVKPHSCTLTSRDFKEVTSITRGTYVDLMNEKKQWITKKNE